jgi:uncharacterized membrane protein YeaQ/YmgE (transglycosylase-associated protein family)
MTPLAWAVLGMISGFVVSKLINRSGEGFLLDVALGVVGALVGGWQFDTFGMAGGSGINLYGIVVAVVGAIVLLVSYHFLVRTAR